MKITIEIPDDTVLATLSLVRQDNAFRASIGTFHLCTADLIDGNIIDYRPKYKESEDTK